MNLTSVDHFIIAKQQEHKDATGEFSKVLSDIIFASKIISAKIRAAGLQDILGLAGNENASGDNVQKLDMYAHDIFVKIFQNSGRFAAITSEESDEVMFSPAGKGKYIIHIDPLDGSSNIDVNVSVGTIFSIYKLDEGEKPNGNVLKPGREQVCAGYVLYGSSTMLVYTTGEKVHGFTLDTDVGEFLLSHEDMRIPEKCAYYSINESYENLWNEGLLTWIKTKKKESMNARWIGSLVADFHRNLLKGGIFIYPSHSKNSQGKLRLMYEANPMAFIAKAAGGSSSNGEIDILDIPPEEIHQRTPLFIGNKKQVEEITKILSKNKLESF